LVLNVFKNISRLTGNLWLTGDRNDYYEPRSAGRYYFDPHHYTFEIAYVSDTRKPVFVQVIHKAVNSSDAEKARGIFFYAGFRGGKQFQLNYSTSFNNEKNKPGFAGFSGSADSIVFASRDIRTVENALGSSFAILWLRIRMIASHLRYCIISIIII